MERGPGPHLRRVARDHQFRRAPLDLVAPDAGRARESRHQHYRALLAGLGVGGVAVQALALQSVLGDLFASLSIALDKPFVVGDRLVIDAFAGTVERIGIKSTRMRSDTGEQISCCRTRIFLRKPGAKFRAGPGTALARHHSRRLHDARREAPGDSEAPRGHRPGARERALRPLPSHRVGRLVPAIRAVVFRPAAEVESAPGPAAGREFPHRRGVSPSGRGVRLPGPAREVLDRG